MKLYVNYIRILFKSELQYRASFFLLSLGQFFVPFTIFISIYFYFQRFPNLGGWTLYEIALSYAIVHIGFSLSEMFARGFDTFSSMIIRGEFDRVLVRPRNTILQILGSKFEFARIGRLFQALIVLFYALSNLEISWNILKIATLLTMMISGVIIFTGIFILGATLSFFTLEGLEVINILTDGGREMSQYPISIYLDWVKKFFTFVIPFGTVNYLPLLYILGKDNNPLYMLSPLLGMLFIIPCILIWKLGVRYYKSTGS